MTRGRKRKIGLREPSGKLQRHDGGGAAPSRLTVLRAAAANAALGTQAGQAWLEGHITAQQHKQAERVAAIVTAYRAAICAHGIRSPGYEAGRGGAEADPESLAGAAEAERDTKAVERYQRVKDRLQRRSNAIWEATLDFSTDVYCDWSRRAMAIIGLGMLVDDAVKRRG